MIQQQTRQRKEPHKEQEIDPEVIVGLSVPDLQRIGRAP
jgi:hypothetical protein